MTAPDRPGDAGQPPPSEALATLLRWEAAGGEWRVLFRGADEVTVGLLTCDGGEQVDVLHSHAADLRAHVTRP